MKVKRTAGSGFGVIPSCAIRSVWCWRRLAKVKRRWSWTVILLASKKCGAAGHFSGIAGLTPTRALQRGSWIRNVDVRRRCDAGVARISHAGGVGAASGDLARLAPRADGLARKTGCD